MASATEDEFDHDVETAIVTGATGEVGSRVVDSLVAGDVDVVGIDLERPAETRSGLSFREIDLRDRADTWETVMEVDPDAVVHCAALSNPLDNPGSRLFENNTMSTYNALVAAGRADASVVWTSSQAVYGALFAQEDWIPDYLPIDEDHPFRPEDPYGVSKVCGEEIAEMIARRYGISVTTLRPATIHVPGSTHTRPPREDIDLSSDDFRGNFGSYVDVRDVVRMIEAALAAELDGHETFLCVADENYLGPPTAEIVETLAGGLPERCEIEGKQAALSNEKARELLGWRPIHSEHEDATAADPDWR